MGTDWNLIELTDLGVLRLRGVEAVKFLQGQVSNDVEKLSPEQSQLAGYHNPQGRVIALLRLVQLAPDDVLALLPRELASPVATRLAKFVLRTKVKITDESAGWKVAGLVAPFVGTAGPNGDVGSGAMSASTAAGSAAAGDGKSGAGAANEAEFEKRAASWAASQFVQASVAASAAGERSSAAAQLEEADSVVELPTASALMLPDAINSVSRSETTAIIRVGMAPARWLVVSPAGEAFPLAGCAAGSREAWRLFDIAAGMAQVYAATSEEFVAQMLNLDALGGISFEKGCYTGQEVIARAHYRGRVKRRMQRFRSRGLAKLAAGESGLLADGRTFKVVEAAVLADGRCEFLAVAPMVVSGVGEPTGAPAPAEAVTTAAVGEAGGAVPTRSRSSGDVPSGDSAPVDAEVLPMSYPLPD
jgi:tRNA-modifying protein YgfZ